MAIGLLYGGSGAEVFLTDTNADGIAEFADSATYTVWSAITGGSQITELYTYPAQAATTTLSPDAIGRLLFYCPSGTTSAVFLRDEANPSNTRWIVLPYVDMATRSGVTAHSSLTGLTTGDDHTQYLNTVRGDARYYLKAAVDSGFVAVTGAQAVAGVKTFGSAPIVPDSSFTIAKTTSLQTTLDAKVAKTDNVQVLANWADATPADNAIAQYDTGTGLWSGVDGTTQFAAVDSNGRIVSGAQPQWYVPIVVVNEGTPPPSNFPVGGIVYSRPAAASTVPTLVGTGTAGSSLTCTVTTTDSYAVGDYVVLAVGVSGENTLPITFTVGYSAGVASMTSAVSAAASGTVQTVLIYGRCTTIIPSGAVITVTASASRLQSGVVAAKVTNLAVSSALDQSQGNNWSASAPLALVVGPTPATTVANEVAISAFGFSPATGTSNRTIAGSNGWSGIGSTLVLGGAGSRAIAMYFKVLTATGAVTANAQITSPVDGSNSAGSGVVISLKAA